VTGETVRHPGSLLVVRLGAMGDVIHTLTAVAALRDALPETRIGWVVEERWAELLRSQDALKTGTVNSGRPLVHAVHTVNTRRWRRALLEKNTWQEISATLREIRAQNYEIAVDFQGALKSALLARLAGTRQVFGMQHPRERPARHCYGHRVITRGQHVIEQYHSLAEAVAGTPLPAVSADFPYDSSAEASIASTMSAGREFVIINPGAGWGTKQWPAERYGQVARALTQDGYPVLINAGPGEEETASIVQSASRHTAAVISCTISGLIALTRKARLFIGGDTGPLHLAAALQVPVVAIYGPTDPARNGPYDTKAMVLRNPASRTSLSHTGVPDPGLLQITTEEVLSAARRLLQEIHA
jgi:lipopolysaccharide heptosyltransferase I